MPSDRPILSLHDVGLAYRRGWREKFWAVKHLSFELYRGETLGIVGRNGAGKSTLLRLLAGIYEPDRGTIEHYNHKASLLALQLGFLGHLTGRQNTILSGMLMGLDRKSILARMDEIIEFSGLAEFIDQPIRTYSAGMRARLGFGVAFNIDPDILLVDEVLGVGDIEFRTKSQSALKQKIASEQSVVLVSHQPATVRELCDRVIWIEEGEIVQQGDVETTMAAYVERKNPKIQG